MYGSLTYNKEKDMAAAYGKDLREKVLKASDKGVETDVKLAEMLNISDRSIRRWRQKERETGTVEAKTGYQKGHSRKLTDLVAFEKFVRENSGLTQREMAEKLIVSQTSVCRTLKKIDFTVKKKQYGYKERNEEQRAAFNATIANINPEDIVFADESGIDNNETYPYGYAPRGKRLHDVKLGYRTQRISIAGALNKNTFFAPFVFEGHCDTEMFLMYLINVLIPSLRLGQYLIIDNASFHKDAAIKAVIEAAGCFLIYLPPYSPDLNPIEHYWHSIKNKLRKLLVSSGLDLIKASEEAFAPSSGLA